MVTNQTFFQKDSENEQENLLGDMVQDAHELLLVTKMLEFLKGCSTSNVENNLSCCVRIS